MNARRPKPSCHRRPADLDPSFLCDLLVSPGTQDMERVAILARMPGLLRFVAIMASLVRLLFSRWKVPASSRRLPGQESRPSPPLNCLARARALPRYRLQPAVR